MCLCQVGTAGLMPRGVLMPTGTLGCHGHGPEGEGVRSGGKHQNVFHVSLLICLFYLPLSPSALMRQTAWPIRAWTWRSLAENSTALKTSALVHKNRRTNFKISMVISD